jgi:hypothetical protein
MLKLKVSFWKNWDCSFGASVVAEKFESKSGIFPTCFIFENNCVEFEPWDPHENALVSRAEIDSTSLFSAEEFVRDTIADVEQLVRNYNAKSVPSNFEKIII